MGVTSIVSDDVMVITPVPKLMAQLSGTGSTVGDVVVATLDATVAGGGAVNGYKLTNFAARRPFGRR